MSSRLLKTKHRKINVLFVIVQLDMMGGSESLVRNLIKNLDRSRFSPSIAWFYGDDPMREFIDLEIPFHHTPKNKRFDFQTMRQLGKIIEKEHIDVVNAHHFLSMVYSYYGCKVKNRCGLIYTEHSEWEIDDTSWKWRIIASYLLNRSDRSIGVGENVTRKLRTKFGLGESKAITVNNRVNIESFSEGRQSSSSRSQLGLNTQDKVIGVVANFRAVKNHIFLLRAFKALLQKMGTPKLVLIGTAPDGDPDNTLPDVLRFIETQGLSSHVQVLGYRSDVPELLRLMDLFCLTSLKEGLPLGLIEAMAAGLPTIGTNVDGIRDTIVDGENGYLVELGDEDSLAEAMSRLLSDEELRQSMGRQSREIARTKYNLRACIESYQNEFIFASPR